MLQASETKGLPLHITLPGMSDSLIYFTKGECSAFDTSAPAACQIESEVTGNIQNVATQLCLEVPQILANSGTTEAQGLSDSIRVVQCPCSSHASYSSGSYASAGTAANLTVTPYGCLNAQTSQIRKAQTFIFRKRVSSEVRPCGSSACCMAGLLSNCVTSTTVNKRSMCMALKNSTQVDPNR